MQHWRHGRRIAAVAALVTALAGAAPAAAAEPSTDREVREFLADHPTATRVAADQVAWDGGDVVLTFPDDDVQRMDRLAASTGGCDAGWSCLYEHPGFGGRKLQFRSCGYTQSLGAYGFARAASSWVNNRGSWTRVYGGGATLWTEYGYAQVSYVGAAANDRADAIHLHC